MKFGLRTPSLKKSIAARTSVKRFVRHNIGLKAPKGYGWFTNPKKAMYNRVYNKTTFSVWKGLKFLSFLEPQMKNSINPNKKINSFGTSFNFIGLVINLLVILIIITFYTGLHDTAIRYRDTYYWSHGAKSDGKLTSGFTSIIMILMLLGIGSYLWWFTLIFFAYVCYFFIDYYQVLLINIPLVYVIIMIAIRKLGFAKERYGNEDEIIENESQKVDESKVDELVSEYNRLK